MIAKRCALGLRKVRFACLIRAAILSAAIAVGGDSNGNVLARVGSEEIRESDFQMFLEATCSPEEKSSALTNNEVRVRALAAFMDLRLLAAKARKDGFEMHVAYQKAREL